MTEAISNARPSGSKFARKRCTEPERGGAGQGDVRREWKPALTLTPDAVVVEAELLVARFEPDLTHEPFLCGDRQMMRHCFGS